MGEEGRESDTTHEGGAGAREARGEGRRCEAGALSGAGDTPAPRRVEELFAERRRRRRRNRRRRGGGVKEGAIVLVMRTVMIRVIIIVTAGW